MKTLKILTVFVICFLFISVYAKAIKYSKDFINFEIVVVENSDLGSDVEKVWNLTYEGSNNPIIVTKRKTNYGNAYVVNSRNFEVCYSSSSKGFGARTVKRAWSSVPPQINNVVLNAEELKRQQILTPLNVDDEKALGLIASYLPSLLNDQYTHLLN
jgi:hypothetical protein